MDRLKLGHRLGPNRHVTVNSGGVALQGGAKRVSRGGWDRIAKSQPLLNRVVDVSHGDTDQRRGHGGRGDGHKDDDGVSPAGQDAQMQSHSCDDDLDDSARVQSCPDGESLPPGQKVSSFRI